MHIFLGRLRQNYPEFFKGRQGNNIKTPNSKQILLKKCLEPSKTRYVQSEPTGAYAEDTEF